MVPDAGPCALSFLQWSPWPFHLDVPPRQLEELSENHVVKKSLHIRSPYAGTVLKIDIREGDYIMEETRMYTLADLSRVWIYADVYEFDLPWIEKNDAAKMGLTLVHPHRYLRRSEQKMAILRDFNLPCHNLESSSVCEALPFKLVIREAP